MAATGTHHKAADTISRRAAMLAPLLAAPAFAQSWPERPIRLIIAFPAGSVTDTLFRNLAEPLARELGQPVVIENRPGGNGVVGTLAARGAPADGHTWLVLSVTNGALNNYTMRTPAYHPLNDFEQIGMVAEAPYMLVAPAEGARDTAQLLARARERPGALTFSHGNSSALIASALLGRMAGVEMTAVPYRGGPEALTDVIAGRIDSTFTDLAAGLAQAREGRVRVLGLTTAQRFPLAPDLPIVAETVPGFSLTVWFGLAVPQGTPAAILARANAGLNAVLAQPETRERLGRVGYTPIPGTGQAAREWIGAELRRYAQLAEQVGLERQ
jgi:tripartite-type tricarboxylate transporter receptor subunit TctC